jgi:hypothetical protein
MKASKCKVKSASLCFDYPVGEKTHSPKCRESIIIKGHHSQRIMCISHFWKSNSIVWILFKMSSSKKQKSEAENIWKYMLHDWFLKTV